MHRRTICLVPVGLFATVSLRAIGGLVLLRRPSPFLPAAAVAQLRSTRNLISQARRSGSQVSSAYPINNFSNSDLRALGTGPDVISTARNNDGETVMPVLLVPVLIGVPIVLGGSYLIYTFVK